jgi:flagella basal body P-ring formation protein FlgA
MMLHAAVFAIGLAPNVLLAETLTASRVVRANAVIEPGDFIVSDLSVPGALTAETDISGMEARVTLYPGRPIMPAHVGPAALVTRNQPVTLIYRNGGLSIIAEARALSRGGVGDDVRVMNLASRATVIGRVLRDGSVEVSSERPYN